MSNKNRSGALLGALIALTGVISTQIGVLLGVWLIHGEIDPAFVVGAETTSGGLLILMFLLSRGTRFRASWKNLRALAVFTIVSIAMNVGFVLSLAAIASGGLTQAILMICELGGAVLITTLVPVIRRGYKSLIFIAALALVGVVVYVDPFGGAAWSTPGLIGSMLVGLGMGVRIEYAAHLPKEMADVGKQVGSVISGLVIIAWSLASNGLPSIPHSLGDEDLFSVDLTALPMWAGAAALLLGVALCGLLTTGLPAFIENAAIHAGASTNIVAIVHMSSPFVATPVDVFAHGAPLPGWSFLGGLFLVITSAYLSMKYMALMREPELAIAKALQQAPRPGITVRQFVRRERTIELGQVLAELSGLLAKKADYCRQVERIQEDGVQLETEVQTAVALLTASPLGPDEALEQSSAQSAAIERARTRRAELLQELLALEGKINALDRQIGRLCRSVPKRLGGTGTLKFLRLHLARYISPQSAG